MAQGGSRTTTWVLRFAQRVARSSCSELPPLGGAVSKIVPKHEAGTLITIPRYLADTVITEFGIARLMDKNHRQRAEELIRIAHPDFREELTKEAKALWG